MKLTIAATILAASAPIAQAYTSYAYWDQQNFQGNNIAGNVDTDRCYGVPNGWNDRIRSIELFNDNNVEEVCSFYNDSGCKGSVHVYTVKAKSVTSLKSIPAAFDKKYSSLICRT